jgi:HAD superfamily hydrolase (TIGR01509 family)
MINAVIFDLGGVLVNDVWEHLLLDKPNGIACRYGIEENMARKIGESLWEQFAYTPETPQNGWQNLERKYWEQCIELIWGKKPPAEVAVEKLIAMTNDFIQPVPGMIPILERLQAKGIELAICSNNNEFWLKYQMDKCDLHRFFNPNKMVLSCRVGYPKSSCDFQMFRALENVLNTPKDLCVFIDDRKGNIVQAEKYGYQGILFVDAMEFDAVLRKNYSL